MALKVILMICQRILQCPEQFERLREYLDEIFNSDRERSIFRGPQKRLVKAVEGGRSANSILRYIYMIRGAQDAAGDPTM